MRDKISSIIKYPLVFIFGAIIIVMFALFIILPENDFSDVENRPLQTMPGISVSSLADGSFMANFETYTTEQLPFREGLVKVKALIKQMTLSNENNGIVRGKDDYLFENTYGLSSQYGKNVAAIRKFTADSSRPVYIAIAPTAPEILKDKVPAGFRTIDQKSELKGLKAQLGDAHFINLYDTLYEHAKSGEEMYYHTDHHWTSLAAYYAYVEICKEMNGGSGNDSNGELCKPIGLKGLTAHEVDDFYGTHYAKFKEYNIKPDVLTYYDIPIKNFKRSDGEYDSLYDTKKLKIYDKYAMFMRGNDDIAVIQTGNPASKNLIVFKDSYANCLIPFLTYHYDTITVVDLRYYSDSVVELLNSDETADVLLLYNFDFVNEDNHFYRLTS